MAFKLINQNVNNNSAEILLYGIIGRYMDIDINVLVKELEELKKQGCKNLTFYVNSDGGEVFQGQALFNYLNRNDFSITWIVDGIAASMMAMLLTNPKHIVIANKYSKLMYHRLDGMVGGNSDEVRSYSDMMNLFESDLIDMFAARTGIDKVKVKKDFFNNTDKWLNAQEALDLGIVNEIRDGNIGISEPDILIIPRDVYNHYQSQLLNLNSNNQTEIEMKELAKLLNLDENAKEEALKTAITNILEKNKTNASELSQKDKQILELTNQLAEQNKAKVKNLIDSAITAKKFGEDMRETYTKMAEGNFATAEKVINSLNGVTPILNQLGKETVPEDQKNWTWDDYHKKGLCENLLNTNKQRFLDLYKAKYNREYKS
ncbi:MAG: Clp protease ClpP [Coriobacteriia bacterium]